VSYRTEVTMPPCENALRPDLAIPPAGHFRPQEATPVAISLDLRTDRG